MNEERIIENLLTIKDADNYPEVDRDCQAGVDLIRKLQRYRDLVWFIANDYHELSHDKVMLQRDDWQKRCVKLRNELEYTDGGFTSEELGHRLNDDF